MNSFGRSSKGALAQWFWTVDRWLLSLIGLLVTLGLLLTVAASQSTARKLELDPLHFIEKQLLFVIAGLGLMFAVSLLSPQRIRRLAVLLFPACFLALIATLAIGPEIKGATRWLPLGGFTVQPSEFLKPCFAVVTAWLLSVRYDDPHAPAFTVSFGLLTVIVAILVLQPDFGQTGLIVMVWLVQAFLAGLSTRWVLAAMGLGGGLLTVAFFTVDHVRERISNFVKPPDEHSQIDKALDAFRNGGLFGQGPGEGSVKTSLPDAHTDFIFAVAGEEFGLFACVALALLYLAIIVRVLRQQLEEEDPFVFLASAGLIIQFGVQAFINMSVNLALMPAKGMTLPFISYGGSSFLALSLGMGMVLALSRRNKHDRKLSQIGLPANPYALAAAAPSRLEPTA
jgi:cell division protein FtsW